MGQRRLGAGSADTYFYFKTFSIKELKGESADREKEISALSLSTASSLMVCALSWPVKD